MKLRRPSSCVPNITNSSDVSPMDSVVPETQLESTRDTRIVSTHSKRPQERPEPANTPPATRRSRSSRGSVDTSSSDRLATFLVNRRKLNLHEGEKVNLHGMWYSTTPQERPRPDDSKFRAKLLEAYVTFNTAATTAPADVETNFWTNLTSLRTLLTPLARSNGTELEIPHSMVFNSRLNVRLDGELEEMIASIEDKDLRQMIQKLHDHPLITNIGARSDVVRFVCGILAPGKVNVYTDVDTLEMIILAKIREHTNNPMSNAELAKSSGIERAKMVANVLSKELGKPIQKKAEVSPDLFSEGYLSAGSENYVQIMIPRHDTCIKIGRGMLESMNEGECTVFKLAEFIAYLPEYFLSSEKGGYIDALELMVGLSQIRRIFPVEDEYEVIDHFRLAESVRQCRDEIQSKADQLALIVLDQQRNIEERDDAFNRMMALKVVFDCCLRIIVSCVNLGTYLPQISTSKSRELHPAFALLIKSILGGGLGLQTSTDSWKGNLTLKAMRHGPPATVGEASLKQAFREIKQIILHRLDGGHQVP
jgi:hypothetical protein